MREFLNRHRWMLHPWAGMWLAVPIAVFMPLIGCLSHNLTSWVALAGSIIAVIGVLTIGRPVIRLGYAGWYKQSQIIDGGGAYEEEDVEDKMDGEAVQKSGPILVIVGTLLNGASGFLG